MVPRAVWVRAVRHSSMGHGVEDDVNAHRIRFLLRELAEVVGALAFAFPAVAVIGIVTRDDAETAFVVVDATDVDFLGVGTFPRDSRIFAAHAPINGRALNV